MDHDQAQYQKLVAAGNVSAAFKMEFNYVTKTAKKQNPVDYKKLSSVVNNLMELYLTVTNIPKYASSIPAISTRLQTDLWELYSTAAHTTLMMTLDDDLWIDGRKAWLKLERWGKSKRFLRAFFHTWELATHQQCRRLYNDFREDIIQQSSVPGLGLRLINEFLQFIDEKFKVPALDKKMMDFDDKKALGSPIRETYKELKAFMSALKQDIFNRFPNGKNWRKHEFVCMARLIKYMSKYLTRKFITPYGLIGGIVENDIQEIIYGFAQICHNICQNLVTLPEKDSNVLLALETVLIPLNESIGHMAEALSRFTGSRFKHPHKYAAFSVYSFLRVLQTIAKRNDLDKTKQRKIVETGLKNLEGSFKYVYSISRDDDNFTNLEHWNLIELTINELAITCETNNLCSWKNSNSVRIFREMEIDLPKNRQLSKMDIVYIKLFLTQLFLSLINDVVVPKIRSSICSNTLSENGIPQKTEPVVLIVDTLLEFGDVKKLTEEDQDLLKLVIFQLQEFFPKETKKLASMSGSGGDENDELTTVWKILSTWQRDLQGAWSKKMEKVTSKPPSLDIEKLSKIKVKTEFKKTSSVSQVCNYVNTYYIAAQLLLILGKREAGNTILKGLLTALVDWYYPMTKVYASVSELLGDLVMDLGSSIWVARRHSHLSTQPEYDDDIHKTLKRANVCHMTSKDKKHLAFGYMMFQDGIPETKKSSIGWKDESITQIMLETSLSGSSGWSDYHDKAFGHVGSMITANQTSGLRYAIQLIITFLSSACDRQFYKTIFASSAKAEGSMKVQKIGKEIIATLRALDKTIWISVDFIDDLIKRGMSIEARMFSNELLVLSDIWGLQTANIMGKTLQIRALELEGQTRKWKDEVPALLKVFDINEDNPFMREVNPQAKAQAISLDPPRRNSSQVDQTNSHLPTAKVKEEFFGFTPDSPMAKKIKKKTTTETTKAFTFQLPVLPKIGKLDLDVARNYVIALTTLFRVHPDPTRAVNAGLFLFKEIAIAGHQLSQLLLELAYVIVLRATELDRPSDAVEYVKNALEPVRNSEKVNPKKCGRFAKLQVAIVIYNRTFDANKENLELTAPFQKMVITSDVKTPARRGRVKTTGDQTPAITPMKPVNVKLQRMKKEKLRIFNDDAAISLATPKSAKIKKEINDAEYKPRTPVSATRTTRTTRATARRMKVEAADGDRAGATIFEDPEEEARVGPMGDIPDLSPIKTSQKDKTEGVRLQNFGSRPVSPIESEINTIFSTHTGAGDSPQLISEEAVLDEALATAKENSDMETIRAIYNLRIGQILRQEQVAQKSTMVLSNSSKLAALHIDVNGVGAVLDTQYCAHTRMSNNVSSVPKENFIQAEDLSENIRIDFPFLRQELNDNAVLVSLIPDVSKTLSCTYENCLALVTRLEPNGKCISIGFDGHAFAKEALRMRDMCDKISEELGKDVKNATKWWKVRDEREKYCKDLVLSVLPDVLGPALALFTFSKSITWTNAVPKPKNSLHADFLSHAIRAWSHLNTLGKTNVAGLVGVTKLDLDRLAKNHVFQELEYQRTTATYLILGRVVQSIAMERMPICQGIRMSRMLSVRHAEYLLRQPASKRSMDISNLLYVVDNQVNLASSAATVGNFFRSVKQWNGYASVMPNSSELIEKLNKFDLYVFAGHGSGSDCVGGWGRVIRKGVKSTMHLIGCASGRLRDHGRTEPRGAVTKVLDSGSMSVMALLWSITDRDIDRYTLRLYKDWFSAVSNSSKETGPCLSRFINECSRACKLPYVNAGATVNYGLIPTCHNIPEGWDKGLPEQIDYKK
ncbi:Oidioi.mRNA.OKI2018_I69.chr1.g2176.t1.cds [Oikopleura dioica]|uniref:separase n=1 Tax=Oikopleura dioica TaxID=34765 RepID=A0ABN7SUJ1_OIKDI|nr:Oidioi.mRNA.OKI2018_I69.chr1.g2176.t1.cds [Oikopleura dioica]